MASRRSGPQDTTPIRWSQDRIVEEIREAGSTTVSIDVPFGGSEFGPGVYRWTARTALEPLFPETEPELEWDDEGGRVLHLERVDGDYHRLNVFDAHGYTLEMDLLRHGWYETLDAIGSDEQAMSGLLNDEEATEALDAATHLVVIDRVKRNSDLAGIPHVALACLDQVLNTVAPPFMTIYACEPFPYASEEPLREQVRRTCVLPDWLTRFWSDAGFARAAGTHIWYRTVDSLQTRAMRDALAAFGLLPE